MPCMGANSGQMGIGMITVLKTICAMAMLASLPCPARAQTDDGAFDLLFLASGRPPSAFPPAATAVLMR